MMKNLKLKLSLLLLLLSSISVYAASVSQTVPVIVSAAKTTSPSGTCIGPSPCTATSIVDSNGVVWTVVSGFSYENGVVDSGANITLLLWYNGVIYANTTTFGWWSHSVSGWSQTTGDPRPPLSISWTPTAPTVACAVAPGTVVVALSISGGDGNPVTLSLSGDVTDFKLSSNVLPSSIIVGPNGVAVGNCGNTNNVTVTATQN